MPQNTFDEKPLVQVITWRHQETTHYMSQCWPSFFVAMWQLGRYELRLNTMVAGQMLVCGEVRYLAYQILNC